MGYVILEAYTGAILIRMDDILYFEVEECAFSETEKYTIYMHFSRSKEIITMGYYETEDQAMAGLEKINRSLLVADKFK